MPAHQRAFLHALAEDFGLDSESQDPEPHRHVCIFKTPRFVSAPRKTLAQCLRIAKAAANLGTDASSLRPATTASADSRHQGTNQPFNAFLLKDPRFGLTIDELDQALAADLGAASRLTFTTSFLPSEEIVIKATPLLTAAAVATSALTPQAVETTLSGLKPAVARTVSRLGLAGAVSLCHANPSLNIVRREGDAPASRPNNTGGWNAVASRGSWRRAAKQAPAAGAAVEQRAPSAFVALKKLELRKKKVVEEEQVEEDWLAAAEKLGDGDGDEDENGSGSGSGSEGVASEGKPVASATVDYGEGGKDEQIGEEKSVESAAAAPAAAVDA
ncbi:hypothetical protein VTK56DRAFT_2460 [Thermocarpiscus australiensis]